MASTVALYPIIAALTAFNPFLTKPVTWQPVNRLQTAFMHEYFHPEELAAFTPDEMKYKGSRSVDEINAFLAANSFDIRLDDAGPRALYSAAIMKILCEWTTPGSVSTINSEGVNYPAVVMDEAFDVVSDASGRPLIMLPTKQGDVLYISEADEALQDFALVEKVRALTGTRKRSRHHYTEVIFPMVDINETSKLDWIIGMQVPICPDIFAIRQAVQQTQFQMDEKGAVVESAAALSMIATGCATHTLTIDKPFYVWIMRKGLSLPLFAAYVDQSAWKKPVRS